MADALDLGSSGAIRESSTLSSRTLLGAAVMLESTIPLT